jgi:hypothetical protein
MNTAWTSPTIITQYSETGAELAHVPWNEDEFNAILSPGIESLSTTHALRHIARSPSADKTDKTYFLSATGYNFNELPDEISGIVLRLTTNRYGRISDETIQLIVDGNPVGNNVATASVDPIKIYGSETDVWGVTNISKSDLLNSDFGILIRLKSHPHYPHRDGANIYSVELQIH